MAEQEPGETVDSFVKKIRILVEECQFTNPDEHIIDALIFGSSSKRTQPKLLEFDKTLTLNRALEIARTEEVTNNQMKIIGSTQIDALKCSGKPHDKFRYQRIRMCGNCCTNHDITDKSLCPAYGTTCKACSKDNHWKRVCRSKPARKKQLRNKDNSSKYLGKPHTKSKRIDAIATDSKPAGVPPITPALDQLYFRSLSINQLSKGTTQALVQVQVDLCHGAEPLWCKIDTGAEGNVIPVEVYKEAASNITM